LLDPFGTTIDTKYGDVLDNFRPGAVMLTTNEDPESWNLTKAFRRRFKIERMDNFKLV